MRTFKQTKKKDCLNLLLCLIGLQFPLTASLIIISVVLALKNNFCWVFLFIIASSVMLITENLYNFEAVHKAQKKWS